MQYKIIYDDSDTRIHEMDDNHTKETAGGELHPTFEDAKTAACDYLIELMGRCMQTLNHFDECQTFEDHGGGPPFTIWPYPKSQKDMISEVIERLESDKDRNDEFITLIAVLMQESDPVTTSVLWSYFTSE